MSIVQTVSQPFNQPGRPAIYASIRIQMNTTEKGTHKGKYKNPKVKKCRKCVIVISKNRIILKSKSSNMQS